MGFNEINGASDPGTRLEGADAWASCILRRVDQGLALHPAREIEGD